MRLFRYNKYGNKRVQADGHNFDSQKEYGRYKELLILQKVGEISDLELQPLFVLQVGFTRNKVKHQAITYIADFRYKENGKTVVEDVKPSLTFQTPVYKLKKKLFLYKFEDVDFREVY